MDSYTSKASQVQTDRCNLFPDARVLRNFRKLKQKLKRPHFLQGTQYQQVFLFEKNGTGKTHIVYFWKIETILNKSYVSYNGMICAHLGSIPYFQI